jgi:hypothetical protein
MQFLRLAVDGDLEIAISQPILDEVRRVLRDKFGWNETRLAEIEMWMSRFTRMVVASQTVDVIKEDPADGLDNSATLRLCRRRV